jgi:hypothetical protein
MAETSSESWTSCCADAAASHVSELGLAQAGQGHQSRNLAVPAMLGAYLALFAGEPGPISSVVRPEGQAALPRPDGRPA